MFDGELMEDKIDLAREKLIENIPISQYLNDMGIYAPEGTGKIVCPNPFHQDGTPSFVYDDNNGECNCFGCELRGSIVELNYRMMLEDIEDYTPLKSIYDLAKEYKVKLPNMNKKSKHSITKNKVKPSKRERFTSSKDDKYYFNKVMELSRLAKKVDGTIDERMEFYRWIDAMWKNFKTPKQVYYKLKYNKEID